MVTTGPSTGSPTGPTGPSTGSGTGRREILGRWFDKLTIRPDQPFDGLTIRPDRPFDKLRDRSLRQAQRPA